MPYSISVRVSATGNSSAMTADVMHLCAAAGTSPPS